MRGRRAENPPPHHQQRRCQCLGPAKPFLQCPHQRLPWRLCQFTAQLLCGADCLAARPGRGHATRHVVQLHAQRGRAGVTPGRGPLRCTARPEPPGRPQDSHHRMPGAVRVHAGRRPAGFLRAGDQRRCAVPQEQLPARLFGQAGVSQAHRCAGRSLCAARQGQLALRRRRRAGTTPQGGAGWQGAGLLPVELLGTQAGHEDHGQCRWLAQSGDAVPPDPDGGRSGRHAEEAGYRPVRDRADGPGRELRDGRLLARRQRLLGGKRPDRLPRARDHHRRQPQNHVQGH